MFALLVIIGITAVILLETRGEAFPFMLVLLLAMSAWVIGFGDRA